MDGLLGLYELLHPTFLGEYQHYQPTLLLSSLDHCRNHLSNIRSWHSNTLGPSPPRKLIKFPIIIVNLEKSDILHISITPYTRLKYIRSGWKEATKNETS